MTSSGTKCLKFTPSEELLTSLILLENLVMLIDQKLMILKQLLEDIGTATTFGNLPAEKRMELSSMPLPLSEESTDQLQLKLLPPSRHTTPLSALNGRSIKMITMLEFQEFFMEDTQEITTPVETHGNSLLPSSLNASIRVPLP